MASSPVKCPSGKGENTSFSFWNWNNCEKTSWSSFMDRFVSLSVMLCHFVRFVSICVSLTLCFKRPNTWLQCGIPHLPKDADCAKLEGPELQHRNRGQLHLPIKDALSKSYITARKHQKHHIWTNLGKPKLWQIRQQMHINLQFICKWPSLLKILGIVYSTIQFSIPGLTGNTRTGEDPDTLGSNSRGPRAAKRVGSSMSSRSLQLLLMVTSNRI